MLDPDDRDPPARSCLIVATSSAASASVRPAPISSSSSTAGSVASARASSRRLRCSRPRLSARRLLEPRSTADVEHLDAGVVGVRPVSGRPPVAAPTKTFSNTVMSPNGRGTWCARPMPRTATAGRGLGVTSTPRNSTAPASGPKRPREHVQQRRLAGAVGPDDADGLAGPTAKSTPSRTASAPKRLLIPTAASIGSVSRPASIRP